MKRLQADQKINNKMNEKDKREKDIKAKAQKPKLNKKNN